MNDVKPDKSKDVRPLSDRLREALDALEVYVVDLRKQAKTYEDSEGEDYA